MSGNSLTSDSLYIAKQNKTVYYNSDSIFNAYVHSGFRVVIGDLYEYYEDVFWNLPDDKRQMELQKMKEIADTYDSDSLRMEVHFLDILCLPYAEEEQAIDKIEKLKKLVNDASSSNNISIKLRSMDAIIYVYWNNKDYAKAFSYIHLLEDELEEVTRKEYPDRGQLYFEIGQAYFFFRDYDKAIPYLRKAMTPSVHYCDRSDLKARNTLGSYYIIRGEIDSAEHYFRSAYNSYDMVKSRSKYDALSLSNLGQCLVMRKNYDEAIPYFDAGLQRILVDNDYTMASEVTVGLANCYIEKGDMRKSKQMIDSSQLYIRKSGNTALYRKLYPLMSKYNIKTGNKKLAAAYIDSISASMFGYMEEYSSLKILRAEQALFDLEKTAKDEELLYQQQAYKNKVFHGLVVISFMALMLIVFVVLYRKNKKAYQALVLKNQDWAEANTPYRANDAADTPSDDAVQDLDEEDISLMKEVEKLVKNDKIFKDLDLTLDSLSRQMGVNRNYLSKAINKTTGKNFNAYINEYRIKEAIKIMSEEKSDLISIDAIALEVGFNNRISFYQSFKKITGLTPSDFRNNKVNSL